MSIASTFWFENFASIFRDNQICDTEAGHFFWDSPNAAQKLDAAVSKLTAPDPGGTELIGVTPYLAGYGISNRNLIPSNAIIDGLTFRTHRTADNGIQDAPVLGGEETEAYYINVYDDVIQLFNNGTPIGNNKSTGLQWLSAFGSAGVLFRTDSFGGPTDTWGANLTPAIINSAGFGISVGPTVNVKVPIDYRNYTQVDSFELTVFYTIPPPPEGGILIQPPGIPTDELTRKHKLNRTIKQKFLLSEEPIRKHRARGTNLFNPKTIRTQEELIKQRTRNVNTFRPKTLEIEESISKNILKATEQITNKILASDEKLSSLNKFFNLFYDKLTDGNVWTASSDPGYFVHDSVYNISDPGSKSIRRASGGSIVPKFSVTSYPLPYDVSQGLYFSGYVYITGSSNYAGLGFCVQQNLIDGYFVVIDTRNNNSSASTRSFRLFKSSANGTVIQQLATYNATSLIEQNLWYRIIIEVDTSGNITAKLYKDGKGSTLVPNATLTFKDNSSPYISGYYGLTAFTTAAFDNLTNITAQFFDTLSKGIRSDENFSRPTLIPGPASIFLANKSIVEEPLNKKLLKATYKLTNNTVTSNESISKIHNLSPGVSRLTSKTLDTFEILSSKNTLVVPDRIFAFSLNDENIFGSNTINPGEVNINSKTINSDELIPKQRINSRYFVNQLSLLTEDLISSNIITARNFIQKLNITSDDFIQKQILLSNSLIRNIALDALETYGSNKLNLNILQKKIEIDEILSTSFIKAFANIKNKSLVSQENFGLIKLAKNGILLTSGIIDESFSNSSIDSQYFINSKQIDISENYSISNININIKPSAVNIEESINRHELFKNIYNIRSKTLDDDATIGFNKFNISLQSKSILDDEIIKINNILNINYLNPKTIDTFENTLKNTIIPKPVSIFPKNISLEENLQILQLFSGIVFLTPRKLEIDERISFNNLYSIENIFQKPLNSDEIFGTQKLNLNISQKPFKKDDEINKNSLYPTNSILPIFEPDDFQQITAVILDDPETTIIYLNTRFPTLPGFSPPITEGPLGLGQIKPNIYTVEAKTSEDISVLSSNNLKSSKILLPKFIESEESLALNKLNIGEVFINPSAIDLFDAVSKNTLYPFWSLTLQGISSDEDIISNKHNIINYASIYPLGIVSDEEFYKLTTRPTRFPGKIYSWYETIYTIESYLDFRKTS